MKRDYYSGFFFNPHELTKIVLQKFYKIILHRVTYHTRRDQRVPPSNFFRHCETFFLGIFFPQRSPLQFLCCFATEWMLENPKGSPLSVFFGTEIFSENKNFSPVQFFDVLRQNPLNCIKMLTISEVSPFQRATRSIFLSM